MAERQKTVGVLTGGGDVPGLNPALKTLVNRAADNGYQVLGIRRGWGGLLNFDRDDRQSLERYVMPLDRQVVRTVDRTGGTFLHTSRTNPAKVASSETPEFMRNAEYDPGASGTRDYTAHILSNLEHLGVDALIAIGGDDTLSYAERLHRELRR